MDLTGVTLVSAGFVAIIGWSLSAAFLVSGARIAGVERRSFGRAFAITVSTLPFVTTSKSPWAREKPATAMNADAQMRLFRNTVASLPGQGSRRS